MAYGIIYESEFDNVAENRYRLEILKKDYAGEVASLILAGVPIKHSWQTDEPKPAIKGSSLIANILNPGGPIVSNQFYAVAYPNYNPLGASFIILTGTEFVPEVGVPFTISGHPDPDVNKSYTPVGVGPSGPGSFFVYVADGVILASSSAEVVTITGSLAPAGGMPITNFYSNEDDTFKCRFYQGTEVSTDYAASAELSYFIGLNQSIIFLTGSTYVPVVGQYFTISGHSDPIANNTFIAVAVTDLGGGDYSVQVPDGTFTDSTTNDPVTITVLTGRQLLFEGFLVQDDCNELMADYLHEISLSFNDNLGLLKDVALDASYAIPLGRISLLDIIGTCLYNTGLELETFVYANIFETTFVTTDSFLAQTFIDNRTFLKGDGFDNCYDILTQILERFNLTLFQAMGAWRIVRWDEIRYNLAVPYYRYSSDFILIGTGTLNSNFITGFEQSVYPETGLMKSIFRPFKYDKETFNYKQPDSLINNANLQDLGTFDRQETDADFTYDYYDFPASSEWKHFFDGDSRVDISQIVVKTAIATGNEVERYVYQPKTNLGGVDVEVNAAVEFNDIQVSAGDVFEFQIKIKAASSTGGDNIVWRFGFLLCPTEGDYYNLVDNAGGGADFNWVHTFTPPNDVAPGISHTIPAADAETYYDYQLSNEGTQKRVPKFPADGVLRIRVYGSNNANGSQPNVDAIWHDVSITMIQFINDSTKIIGQTHTSSQSPVIKNNEDVEIQIDDSPRNTIAGTLYIATMSGLVALRTTAWYRLSNPGELLRIGQITTFEQLFWRRVPRTKLEGTFYGVLNVSMLAILSNVSLDGLNFIFGSLEIDYKNNSFNSTMWEIFKDDEVDGDLTSDYVFKYLYDTK